VAGRAPTRTARLSRNRIAKDRRRHSSNLSMRHGGPELADCSGICSIASSAGSWPLCKAKDPETDRPSQRGLVVLSVRHVCGDSREMRGAARLGMLKYRDMSAVSTMR
jgi:hypothetical protein